MGMVFLRKLVVSAFVFVPFIYLQTWWSVFILEVSMFKRQMARFWLGFWILAGLSLACNFSGDPTATAVPTPIPTQVVIEGGETAVLPTAIPLPTDTAVPPAATDTAVAQPTATATETPETAAVDTAASPTPAMVGTAVRLFGPGQQDSFALEPGGVKTYPIHGVRFQPMFVFAEASGEADLRLAMAGETAVNDPAAATPLTEANFNPAGRPEVMVFSPDADGLYTLIVGNKGSGAGETAVYLFDEATDTPLATHYRGETLAAGQTKSFAVQSNGGRPVVAFAVPRDQSDLVLKFVEAGSIANEANYSGPGSAEAAFVLPLRTTDYTIEISAANGGAAAFTLIVVVLE